MSSNDTMLHMVCGKIAAGKSTLTAALGAAPRTIIVSEDHWLARLYPGEQDSLDDYVRNATRLRRAMTQHLIDLLRARLSVVLDFPANTPASRAWMRTLFEGAGCAHRLHFLDVPDATCLARLKARNAAGGHDFTVDEATFALFTSRFVPPAIEEGFDVLRYDGSAQKPSGRSIAPTALR